MMSCKQAATIVNGQLNRDAGEAAFDYVQTDSRQTLDNALFVAIKGANFDGHDFVESAAQKGAACALVEHYIDVELLQIKVHDTTAALGQLAQNWRKHFSMPVVGITGSNGKTTVSAMTASILRKCGNCLSPAGSFNNHWGVPITLLQLNQSYDFAVIEMGMNHAGEIDYLTHVASPNIALINNIAGAHLEGLGSMDNIARAKQEIFDGLTPGGTAVINLDEPYHLMWLDYLKHARADVKIFTFSAKAPADLNMQDYQPEGFGSRFTLQYANRDVSIRLNVPGEHNAKNALAAAACAIVAGANLDAVVNGLAEYQSVNQRVQIKSGLNGSVIIDDSFNANPASVRAGIDLLCQHDDQFTQHIAVLGNMAELGSSGVKAHQEVGQYAAQKGVDMLLALQETSQQHAKHYADDCNQPVQIYDDVNDLIAQLKTRLNEKTLVLVKGSKSAKMNRVVAAIINNDDDTGGQTC